jgi:chromosome segregation ATPase
MQMSPVPRRNSNDSYIDEIRDTSEQNAALKKHMGFYRSADVENYVNSLLDQIQNTETVYQDRSEEMRSSLLLITRERDEKIQRIKVLEDKLAEAQDLQARLAHEGLVTVPKETFEQFESENRRLLQKNEELMLGVEEHPDQSLLLEEFRQTEAKLGYKVETMMQLEKELAAAQGRNAELQSLLDTAQQVIEDLTVARNQAIDKFTATAEENRSISDALQEQTKQISELQIRINSFAQRADDLAQELGDLKILLKKKTDEVDQLTLDLQANRKMTSELQLMHEALKLQTQGLNESVNQTRGQHQILQVQYEIGQNMVARLMAEKTSLENEIRTNKQSYDIQRDAMLTRFQSILNGQNQFLKQLQDSFDSSVLYMRNLTETGLRNFEGENTDHAGPGLT